MGDVVIHYYDRQGRPLNDCFAWAKLFEDRKYARIALTILPDGKEVSTVWLGLDHNYFGGPPLIFETMVFRKPTPEEVVEAETPLEDFPQHPMGEKLLASMNRMREKFKNAPHECDMMRYSTEDDAIAGHYLMVEKWNNLIEGVTDETASEHSRSDTCENGQPD